MSVLLNISNFPLQQAESQKSLKNHIYNAHEYDKTIKSMKKIYMLPASVKALKIKNCSCTKSVKI